MITECGKPLRIDRTWFLARYGQNFPDLLDEDKEEFLNTMISDVYTMFYGVQELWSNLPRTVYEDKTRLCYGLLVAWYITDTNPEYAEGVMTTGGIPLKAKKIGGVTVQFTEQRFRVGSTNNANLLQSLKSNAFGSKAYDMIKMSARLNLFLGR